MNGRGSSWLRAGALASVAAVSVAVLIVIVIKWAPQWLTSANGLRRNDRAAELGRVRTALLATLAGLLAVVGAYYTSRTFALNRQGQITERFTRAVDQLGSEQIDVRLGGIYALERLSRESRDDYGPILEILTAYVRLHAPWPLRVADTERQAPRTDIQAVLTVLGRRRIERALSTWRLDLRSTALSGASLARAYLLDADLREAHLDGADLTQAHLSGANLREAHLDGADLREAHLVGADLRDADLRGANLREAHLRSADLRGADLLGANLKGAVYDPSTEWPTGYGPAAHVPTEQQ